MKRILPWIMFVVMELTLITLGVWQLQRLTWKETLLIQRQAAIQAPLQQISSSDQLQPFQRATVTCTAKTSRREQGFDAQKNIAVRLYRLCQLESGPGLVVRSSWMQADDNPSVDVSGRLLPWTPETFYSRWTGGSGLDLKSSWAATAPVADVFLQEGDSLPPELPNNHFAYAIQWFLFAGVLGIIFALYQRRQGR
jgi:surfeit locus 1 family protein